MHMHAFRRQWTVEDLHDMPDDGQRYEVIDGELFVTPSPSADHQHALSLLFRLIADYVDRERIGHAFFSPSDITFSPRRAQVSFTQPTGKECETGDHVNKAGGDPHDQAAELLVFERCQTPRGSERCIRRIPD